MPIGYYLRLCRHTVLQILNGFYFHITEYYDKEQNIALTLEINIIFQIKTHSSQSTTMNDSSSSNIDGVLKRKRHVSTFFFYRFCVALNIIFFLKKITIYFIQYFLNNFN